MWSTAGSSKVHTLTEVTVPKLFELIREVEGRARNGPLRNQKQLVGDFIGAIGLALRHRSELDGNGDIFGILSGGLGGLTFHNRKAVTQIIYEGEFKVFRATNARASEAPQDYQGPFGWVTLKLPEEGSSGYDYLDEHKLFAGRNAIWHYPKIDLDALNQEIQKRKRT
jgi:hypothetical protein